MNKSLSILLSAVLASGVVACGGGGGGSSTGSNSGGSTNNNGGGNTEVPLPPPAPKPSVSVIDVRGLQDGEFYALDLDLVATSNGGVNVDNLTVANFVSANSNAEVNSVHVLGTPETVDEGVIPGEYSVVAMLDQSDSIQTTDPHDLRLDAVETLLNLTQPDSEAHVIAFAGTDDQVRTERDIPQQFYSVTDGFVTEIDSARLNALRSLENGATPLYDALDHGLEQSLFATNVTKAVFVIADGENTILRNIGLDDVINKAVTYQVPIYTIGLGADVDANELIKIANDTGGSYVLVESAAQLNSAVSSLVSVLRSKDESIVTENRDHYTVRILVTPNGNTIAGSITVRMGAGDVNVPYFFEL